MSNLTLCNIAILCIFIALLAYRGSAIRLRDRRIKMLEHELSVAQKESLQHKHRVAFWQRKHRELEACIGNAKTDR